MIGPFRSSEDPISKLKKAEDCLVEYAKNFGDRDPSTYTIATQDTSIPSEVLPLKKGQYLEEDLRMHSLRVAGKETDPSKHDVPLVILHGYMNGALYFYRNVVGLSNYFDTVYSVDTLGCGLSSRSPGLLSKVDSSTEATEAFFVEALEEWRKANSISKMILAGHSMGGYIGVAYCERYPDRVAQLVLLSPAGVTRENEDEINEWLGGMSWTQKTALSGVRRMFDAGVTPASFSRKLPSSRSRSMVDSYVKRRLPAVSDREEREALAEYLHLMAMIPGFGEDMLNRFLKPSSHGVKPTIDRIPKLRVPKVSFLYGDRDWMDIEGGIEACDISRRRRDGPDVVEVYQLPEAGHLLMLDNWRGFHAGVVSICGGGGTVSQRYPMPMLVRATH